MFCKLECGVEVLLSSRPYGLSVGQNPYSSYFYRRLKSSGTCFRGLRVEPVSLEILTLRLNLLSGTPECLALDWIVLTLFPFLFFLSYRSRGPGDRGRFRAWHPALRTRPTLAHSQAFAL